MARKLLVASLPVIVGVMMFAGAASAAGWHGGFHNGGFRNGGFFNRGFIGGGFNAPLLYDTPLVTPIVNAPLVGGYGYNGLYNGVYNGTCL